MRDTSNRPAPTSSGDHKSFRLLSNVLDIASALAEVAEALAADFGAHTEATLAALDFVSSVKREQVMRTGVDLQNGHDVGHRAASEWIEYHSMFLAKGFEVYSQLRAHSRLAVGRSYIAPLARLGTRLSDGYRMAGRDDSMQDAA